MDLAEFDENKRVCEQRGGRNTMRFYRTAVAAVLFLLGGSNLYSQSTISGFVTGQVTDPSKAAVSNASVTLTNSDTAFSQTATADSDGVYHFNYVAPGNYKLAIRADGFTTSEASIVVTVGQSTTTNVQLKVGTSASSVVVEGDATAIQTENGDITTSFNEKQIRLQPNPGQDLTYLAQTAPGAVMNTSHGGGNFSVFGLPSYSNMFTINGMDYLSSYGNNNKSGATNNSLGTNEMQSATVVENGYSGNYGRLVGSNVNFVSKSGANQFHGNAIYDWNGSSLNANDFFNNRRGTPRPFNNVNQWAASIGGPIWRNHTYFFVNAEGLRIVIPTTSAVNIPSPEFEAATLANLQTVSPDSVDFYNRIFTLYDNAPGASRAANVLPNGGCGSFTALGAGVPCALQFQAIPKNFTAEWLLSWRVDQIISSKDQSFLRIQTDHGLQASTTNVINPIFNSVSPQPEWQGQWNETHTFNSRAVNQFIAAFQWSSITGGPPDIPATLAVFPTQLAFSGGSLTTLGQSQAYKTGRPITQYQIIDDFSITYRKHTFKAGVDFLRDDINLKNYGTNTAGVITTSLANFYNGSATTYNISFPTALQQPFAAYDLGFYVQDDWAVSRQFKLTLALRFDRDANSTCLTNCFARLSSPFSQIEHDATIPYNQAIDTGVSQTFYGTTALSFEPRLGFAWSPFGSTRTVIRGGIGNFADAFPQSVIANFALNPPLVNTFNVGGRISPDAANSVFSTAANSNTAFLNGFSQGATLADLKAINPSFSPPAYFGAQQFTTVPTYLEWNLQVQRALGNSTTVSANYVGNRGIHEAFRNAGLNAYNPAGYAGLPTSAIDPRFSTVTELQTIGTSRYNGLVLSAEHRFSHGFQASFNYTYSHALDNVSNNGFSAASSGTDPSIVFPQDPNNPHANFGNSDYDTRHSFNASYVWLPAFEHWVGHGPKLLLGGWNFSGTFFGRTGLPFTVIDSATSAALSKFNYGATVFANYLGGGQQSCNPNSSCLNLSDFSSASAGFGTQTRNQFRGPAFFNTDLSILKSFPLHLLGESSNLAVGVNFYNVLNHPNFDSPVNDIANSQFGQITKTVSTPTGILGAGLGGNSSPRQIQLTAKFVF